MLPARERSDAASGRDVDDANLTQSRAMRTEAMFMVVFGFVLIKLCANIENSHQ